MSESPLLALQQAVRSAMRREVLKLPPGALGVLAQSFTAGQSRSLVKAEPLLRHSDNFSATCGLFLPLAPLVDAFSGSNAIASAQVAASSLGSDLRVISFAFSDRAPVQAGKSYALILSYDRSGSIAWSSRIGTDCDGRSFDTFGGGAPFEVLQDLDHIFTTFVQA